MQAELSLKASPYRTRRTRRKTWNKVVTVLASIVVFCTTYALILPAITMESDHICGLEAHTHEDSCYQLPDAIPVTSMVCEPSALGIHEHAGDCYDETGQLRCGLADFVLHTHQDSCYDAGGEPVCPLPEIEEHIHSLEDCWQQPHVHEELCYTMHQGELLCAIEEGAVHTHAETCYTPKQNWLCTLEEVAPHTHGAPCYTQTQELVCTLEETEGHAHMDACYDETGSVICGLPEMEGHAHGGECYQMTEAFTCELEETEGHTHTEACFELLQELSCTQEADIPHAHSDACYTWTSELTCTQLTAGEGAVPTLTCEEQELYVHTHETACYDETGALLCGLLEVGEHSHGGTCFVVTYEQPTEPVLACGMEAHEHIETCLPEEETADSALDEAAYCGLAEHAHIDTCWAGDGVLMCTMTEHTHQELCWLAPADLTAVETAEDWEADLPELTGGIAADLIAVAQSQLGYEESAVNYTVTEDGEVLYYSRYAAWWDETQPYGGWNAKFVAFCLDYAGITGVPLEPEAAGWPDMLADYGQWQDNDGEFVPIAADLVFFDNDGDGTADRAGIITQADAENGAITVILERRGLVQQVNYDLSDGDILGYGRIPGNEPVAVEPVLTDAAQAVIDQIDALPTYDEIYAQLDAYYEAGDTEGEEAYYTAVVQQVNDVYFAYNILTDEEKAAVTNADKLLELEPIWSAATLIDEIKSDTPTTVKAASTSEFIELNLYDYGSNINTNYNSDKKYPGFQWNGGAYLKSTYDRHVIDYIDFGNSMITDFDYVSPSGGNNGKSSSAQDITKGGTGINAIDNTSYGVTNRPIGMSLNSSITSTATDVLSRTLGSDGYPALKDGTSLSYLFEDGPYADKQNSTSIDGLFQQDSKSGEYYYNSRENHAQYSSNKFTLYNQIITPNFITYPFGNFLPLNTITDGTKATQVSKIQRVVSGSGSYTGYMQTIINRLLDGSEDSTENQLVDMLAKYRDSLGESNDTSSNRYKWTAADAMNDYFHGDGDNPSDAITFSMNDALLKKMYNIDWNVDTNFFFGMEMKMNFMQPKGGMTGNDTNGDGESDYPMVFYFTGDDDVWVYIDDVLFLDLSGIHRHVGGEIDFVNGKVHYYHLDTEKTGDVSSEPYQTYTFAEILAAAGKSTDGLNSKGTFKDYTTHSFNFYYTERGSGSSVCRINFNFPLLKKNSIAVTKENVPDDSNVDILGSPDYYFNIVSSAPNAEKPLVGPDSITGVTTYRILDGSGKEIGTEEVDQYGIFILKAGQTAVFEGIEEDSGGYHVQELIKEKDHDQYKDKVSINGTDSLYNDLIHWAQRPWVANLLTFDTNDTLGDVGPYGSKWYGYSSTAADASANRTFSFNAQNGVLTDNLGSLEITKKLMVGDAPQVSTLAVESTAPAFTFSVTLDGAPLPVGTEYTVTNETTPRTVETAGQITVPAGATATISNILSGAQFEVTEIGATEAGYTVRYQVGDGEITSDSATGIIRESSAVAVTVTNYTVEKTVEIPVVKYLSAPDANNAHTFQFKLVQVTSKDDSTLKGTEENDWVTSDTTVTANPITVTIPKGGATANNGFLLTYDGVETPERYYYQITEVQGDETNVIYDPAVYLVEVSISAAGEASVTGMWKDGVKIETLSADFTNTLVGDLKLSKTVVGTNPEGGFPFTIKTEPKLSGEYPAVTENGTKTTVEFTDGVATVTLADGQSITIHDIPIGTTWTITETAYDGYAVTHMVDGVNADGAVSTGSITTGETEVAYTNSAMYALPETGGGGAAKFLFCGGMLMAFPLLLLGSGRRRRSRGRRVQGG